MSFLHIDFETRSPHDLAEVGIDVYVNDPHADVWCMGYALNDAPPTIWTPQDGHVCAVNFITKTFPSVRFVAHNAAFELAVWNTICVPKYGWPVLDPARIDCTMAQGYAMSLPGALDNMRAALGIQEEKDLAGSRLAKQMSSPRGMVPCVACDGSGFDDGLNTACDTCRGHGQFFQWWDEPEKRQRLYDYCKQDVRVEREVHHRLLRLSPSEQKLWVVDSEINRTGICLDRPAVRAAMAIVALEQDRLEKELTQLTGGAVDSPAKVTALTEWVATEGLAIPSLQKTDVIDILAQHDVPPKARRGLEIRQEYSKTSVAKLRKMEQSCSSDQRLKHILQYHTAGTGRWGGRRVQPQNMPRPKLKQKEIDAVLDFLPVLTPHQAIERMDLLYGAPMNVLSDCLRGMLRAAPGHQLMAGDFSNIEGRTLAWLAGEEWKLAAFRDFDAGLGPDLYLLAAARIYHRAPSEFNKESPERQIGKVAELACGYQGGVGAFQTMAYTYGVRVPEAEADAIKTAWREANPRIVSYWYELEDAAKEAVAHPGAMTFAGPASARVRFKMSGSFLFCLLPSGRMLCYPYPRLKMKMTPWGDMKEQVHYKSVDDRTKQWAETSTYGGKLAENITQAVSRDMLADRIVAVHDAGLKIVLHVHDEIVIEAPQGALTLGTFLDIMRAQPVWSRGLPIAVSGWEGVRYRK